MNGYIYVMSNPVNLTDPSGNCIPEYSCPGDHYSKLNEVALQIRINVDLEDTQQACGGIPPSLTWSRQDVSQFFSVVALGSDYLQTGISGIGIAMEAIAGLGGDTLDPVGPPIIETIVVGVKSYGETIDPIETSFSAIGFASTAVSDAFAGNTYIDTETKELVIGQDTYVSSLSLYLSAHSPEAILDTGINVATTFYDFNRFNGKIPTIMEIRLGSHLVRLEYLYRGYRGNLPTFQEAEDIIYNLDNPYNPNNLGPGSPWRKPAYLEK